MKKILLYIPLFLLSLGLSAQVDLELKTAQTAGSSHTACRSITLAPGFRFTAAAGKTMILTVNSTSCDPFAGKTANLSVDQNYIRTRTYLTTNGKQYLDQIQYFDGLGRPVQTVQRGITPSGNDLVSRQEYDDFGRESNSWLPVPVSTNGAFVSAATIESAAKATYQDEKPYARPIYEASPLNRVLAQYGPGDAWHQDYSAAKSRPVKTDYLTNTASGAMSCIRYYVKGSGTGTSLEKDNYYAANQLYVTKITNEDNQVAYEFKDKLGQVVLTRQMVGTDPHDTYYVHDEFGNLCYVLPPRAATTTEFGDNSNTLKQLVYLYKYDARNRCITKRIPGTGWTHYIHDKADQVILTQDGEQRNKGEWFFTIPDVLGRPVLSGICKNTHSIHSQIDVVVRGTLPDATVPNGIYGGYTVTGITLNAPTIYTVNYYDNYRFKNIPVIKSKNLNFDKAKGADYNKQYGDDNSVYQHKGLLTGNITAQLDGGTAPKYLYTALYYDNKKNLIQSQSTNHLEGTDSEFIAYNFTGQPLKKESVHKDKTTTQSELYTYSYDHAGRLVNTNHKLNNGQAIQLAYNGYDDLGRVSETKKSNHSSLATKYKYNVRSWLKEINSPLYVQLLSYNDSSTSPSYSGNISAISWTVKDDKKRGYTFKYDQLSRLTYADYNENGSASHNYNTSYKYDKHGNMTHLKRVGNWTANSHGMVDDLTMTYGGNQLLKVVDDGATVNIMESSDFKDYTSGDGLYGYNSNGALNKDTHKGISEIRYNSLNLPQAIVIANSQHKGKINYTYSANGSKLRIVHEIEPNLRNMPMMGIGVFASTGEPKVTDYVGNKVYENNRLKRILVDGGYYDAEKKEYFFYMTDHLGNNRVVADKNGTIVQKNHYYPFGMSFAESTNSQEQPYKYNGKELDETLGLNVYDYLARQLEVGVPRFTSMDPLAEKFYSWSPYVYCYNNPMRFVDPDGKNPVTLVLKGARVARNVGRAYKVSRAHQTTKGNESSVSFMDALIDNFTNQDRTGTRSQEVHDALTKDIAPTIESISRETSVSEEAVISETNSTKGITYENKDGNNKPTKSERALEKQEAKKSKSKTRETNTEKDIVGGHRTGKSNSKKGKHEQGDTRRDMDQNRKEKGDKNRPW